MSRKLVGNDPTEIAWLHLKRLSSAKLCEKSIASRETKLPDAALEKKAQNMAWAIKSALGYWDTKSQALNAKILSRYYAILHISIAEQVAFGGPEENLSEIQRHTEFGHGLFQVEGEYPETPLNFRIGCLKSGHFHHYLNFKRFPVDEYFFEKRPRTSLDKDNAAKTILLVDLFRRVPEIEDVVFECFDALPLSFHISLDNQFERAFLLQRVQPSDAPDQRERNFFRISIHPKHESITKDYLNSLNLPIRNIEDAVDAPTGYKYFSGDLPKGTGEYWYHNIETYKSDYCGTSYILPFWNQSDIFILHLTILYSLSILVRYLPDKWQKIESGDHDHIHMMLEYYLYILDRILPSIFLGRLTGETITTAQPGSLNAPI